MKIEKRTVVTLEYTLRDDDGEVLDSSDDGGPLDYLHGAENIVPGLESALEGKTVGDSLKVVVEPKDGYGERDEGIMKKVPRSDLPQGEVEVGDQFQIRSDEGILIVTIADLTDDEATLDANHPLAGKRLHFDVKVLNVRDASLEELAHGHAYGSHGHGHHH